MDIKKETPDFSGVLHEGLIEEILELTFELDFIQLE